MSKQPATQSRRLELAAQELRDLGVDVFPAPPDREHIAFQFSTWSKDQVFADRSGEHFREEVVDGHFVNPMGYRQDVHEVLRKHRLVTDWWDEHTIDVSRDSNSPGWTHGYKLYLSEYDEARHRVVVRLPPDERAAILARKMSESEGIESFIWDGADPSFSELSLQDRLEAIETTPLPARPIALAILAQLIGSVLAHEHDLSTAQDELYELTWLAPRL